MSTPRILRRPVPAITPDFEDAAAQSVHPRLLPIYLARGVTSATELDYVLGGLQKPAQLHGVEPAADLLADAVTADQCIVIVGDFDADGATSTALACLALRAMGASNVHYVVPNRFEYGYGLTPEIVEVAARLKPDLIVTVDNGISSITGVERATQLGISVLVTDHHLPGEELPAAAAIVNPNQPGCRFPSKNLAGVGVIFYVMSALRAKLRQRNWFEQRQIPVPNMAEFLDLVALGTVADVVPLDRNNRILVQQGLQRIRAGRARPGILALIEVSGRSAYRLCSTDLGFAVGPRLNAAGRLDDMSLGIECLLCDSPSLAREMAQALDEMNRDRRSIEKSMQQEALASLQSIHLQEDDIPTALCLYDPLWHQGVIGILAARIRERFHRPVIIFADGDLGEIKGSARSIPGLHIRDALARLDASFPGLIIRFGGHAMAAGLTIARENLARFEETFQAVVAAMVDDDDLEARVLTDGELDSEELTLEFAEALRNAGPWGQHFPEPLFEGRFDILQQRVVGGNHLKLALTPVLEGQAAVDSIDAIWFNADLESWPRDDAGSVNAVYQLDVNEFRGRRTCQLIVQHLFVQD